MHCELKDIHENVKLIDKDLRWSLSCIKNQSFPKSDNKIYERAKHLLNTIATDYARIMELITSRIDHNRILASDYSFLNKVIRLSNPYLDIRPAVFGEDTTKLLHQLRDYYWILRKHNCSNGMKFAHDAITCVKKFKVLFIRDLRQLLKFSSKNYKRVELRDDNRVPLHIFGEIVQSAVWAIENLEKKGIEATFIGSIARGNFEKGSDLNLTCDCSSISEDYVEAIVKAEQRHCPFNVTFLRQSPNTYFFYRILDESIDVQTLMQIYPELGHFRSDIIQLDGAYGSFKSAICKMRFTYNSHNVRI